VKKSAPVPPKKVPVAEPGKEPWKLVPQEEGRGDAPDLDVPPGVRGYDAEPTDPDDVAFEGIHHQGLRFAIPQGWQDRSVVTFMEPSHGGFRRSVILNMQPIDPRRTDLKAFVDGQIVLLREKLKEAVVTAPVPRKTATGLQVMTVTLALHPRGGEKVRQLQAFFVAGKTGYVLTCTAEHDAFDAWLENVFEPILSTLSLQR